MGWFVRSSPSYASRRNRLHPERQDHGHRKGAPAHGDAHSTTWADPSLSLCQRLHDQKPQADRQNDRYGIRADCNHAHHGPEDRVSEEIAAGDEIAHGLTPFEWVVHSFEICPSGMPMSPPNEPHRAPN